MRVLPALGLILFLISGCIEEYDLYPGYIEPRLVVEGLITNKPGPYYIRLTESHTGNLIAWHNTATDSAVAVLNARIIITDDIGQVDTLIPVNADLGDYEYNSLIGYYTIRYDDYGNIIDTVVLTDPPAFRYDRGFYKTQHLIGIPGRTYYLEVISNGKEYRASDYMPSVPEIDSVKWTKKILEKDGQEYYTPLLYFSEPQGIENYYLVQFNDEEWSRFYTPFSFWQFSIISDRFLQPYVNGLNVDLGASPGSDDYIYFMGGENVYIALSSLSKNAYEFYDALLKQFNNDGGAYQPSPGSPPTNISNSGLGFFRASAISEKEVQIHSNKNTGIKR
jgi:hypothetical protein